jgi:hypothetical protein
MLDLKALYGKQYRLTLDESVTCGDISAADRLWLWQIPCKYGHIFVWAEDRLGAYCNRPIMRGRLLAIPGVKVQQRGDREVNVSFDPALFTQVADLLQARKRKVFSPEEQARLKAQGIALAARTKQERTKSGQESSSAASDG